MEPIFKSTSEKPEDWLVPQIQIALGKDTKEAKATRFRLLDLAHRGADAVVQSSGQLAKDVRAAFAKLRETGDAAPLCAIAPTSSALWRLGFARQFVREASTTDSLCDSCLGRRGASRRSAVQFCLEGTRREATERTPGRSQEAKEEAFCEGL